MRHTLRAASIAVGILTFFILFSGAAFREDPAAAKALSEKAHPTEMNYLDLSVITGLTRGLQDPKPKKKEVIVAINLLADPANKDIRDTADKLNKELAKGYDVQTIVMGRVPTTDIPSLDELKDAIRGKDGKNPCIHSIHFLGHSMENNGEVELRFPPDSSGHEVRIGKEEASVGPGDYSQYGKANFAKLLDDILCPDGEVYLEECCSAKGDESLAKRVADETGRTVYGYTGGVLFPGATGPRPAKDSKKDDPTAVQPTTPSAQYETSEARPKGGRTYWWDITSNLRGVCDVHIKIDDKLDPKKFSGFTAIDEKNKALAGWSGSVTKGEDGNYLSFYATDCEKGKQTGKFKVHVDFTDPKAQDKDPKDKKVIFTSKGGATYKTPDDVIKQSTTKVPEMLLSSAGPMLPSDARSGEQATTQLIGLVYDKDIRPGEQMTMTLTADARKYENIPGLGVIQVKVPANAGATAQDTLSGVVIDAGTERQQPASKPLMLQLTQNASNLALKITARHYSATDTYEYVLEVGDGAKIIGGEWVSESKTPHPDFVWLPTQASIPVVKGPSNMVRNTGAPSDFTAPPVCQDTNFIRGPFSGNAHVPQIMVDDQAARIVAGSSTTFFFDLPPEMSAGPHQLAIQDGSRSASFPIVRMGITGHIDQPELLTGQKTNYSVTVNLGQLPDSVWQHGGGVSPELTNVANIQKLAPGFHIPQAGEPGVVLERVENASRDTVSIKPSQNETVVRALHQQDFQNNQSTNRGEIQSKKSGSILLNLLAEAFFAPIPGQEVPGGVIAGGPNNPISRQFDDDVNIKGCKPVSCGAPVIGPGVVINKAVTCKANNQCGPLPCQCNVYEALTGTQNRWKKAEAAVLRGGEIAFNPLMDYACFCTQ